MKKILFVSLLFGVLDLVAQTQSDSLLMRNISSIQNSIEEQKQEFEELNSKLDNQQTIILQQRNSINELISKATKIENTVDSLSNLVEKNRSNINIIAEDFGTKIQKTEQHAENRISELGGDVKKSRSYWIIATLGTLLLGVLMYLFLGKRINSSQTDLEIQIMNTKKSLEEESLKLDNKLIEVLEIQLKVQQEESKNQPVAMTDKADHSLALKVADEIVRMQKNISRMDTDIIGLKPLEKGIERIQANFAANGYEMTDLLNKKFDDRMTIEVVNVLDDESLPKGEKIITRIIRPQVLYNGVLIQRAQVEVSQN